MEYDAELGKITEIDREYARDMLEEIGDSTTVELITVELIQIAAEWLRKSRYEAVMADRKNRQPTR